MFCPLQHYSSCALNRSDVKYVCVMCLQEAGAGGAAGPSAVMSVAVESRCAAVRASLRTASVRASWRRDGPATPSPASVSSMSIDVRSSECQSMLSDLTFVLICAGQVRQRSQGLRSIIGQRRDSDGTIMANQAPQKGVYLHSNTRKQPGIVKVLC